MDTSHISREKLLELYTECDGDLTLIAERVGLSKDSFTQQITPDPVRPVHRRQPPADLGRASLRKYIISVRHADNPCTWPLGDRAAIERARHLYELGTHEMFQGRDKRGWIIQYLQARKVPTTPRKFFRDIF